MIQIVECPRDAMQGIHDWIPTEQKRAYLQALLAVGFDTLDFGSFVSPKAVPQMKDTAEVLAGLSLDQTTTKLLAIVVNQRGAESAAQFDEIHYLGYPFSLSETFQLRNSRKTIAESYDLIQQLQEICAASGKELLLYFSMGFGNPYGDPWNSETVAFWAEKMNNLGIKTIMLADTDGGAKPEDIGTIFTHLLNHFPAIQWGAHFHALPQQRIEKISAAWAAGCRRFDTALMGFGGCPFAKDELVGNIATEDLLYFCQNQGIETQLNMDHFGLASKLAQEVFG